MKPKTELERRVDESPLSFFIKTWVGNDISSDNLLDELDFEKKIYSPKFEEN